MAAAGRGEGFRMQCAREHFVTVDPAVGDATRRVGLEHRDAPFPECCHVLIRRNRANVAIAAARSWPTSAEHIDRPRRQPLRGGGT